MRRTLEGIDSKRLESFQERKERRLSEGQNRAFLDPQKVSRRVCSPEEIVIHGKHGSIKARGILMKSSNVISKIERGENFSSVLKARMQQNLSHIRKKNPAKIEQQFEVVNKIYSIRHSENIRSFITHNDLFVPKVSALFTKLREQFPSENMFLDIYSSPEQASEREVLISISTTMPPNEAIERLDKIDDQLWLEDSGNYFVNICLKLEYK